MEDTKYYAVIYTDGSCINNPSSNWGSGIHGYIYSEEDIGKKSGDRPNNFIITEEGYLENNLASKTEHKTVIPTCYVNGYTSHNVIGSNNTGELFGVIYTLEEMYHNEYNIVSILILSDSMYTIGAFNKVNNPSFDWRSKNPANFDILVRMETICNKLRDKGVVINIKKVLAHSTDIGNYLADRMAFLGRYISTKHNREEYMIKYTDKQRYWKPKIEKHPMIPYRNLFFINNKNKEPMYIILNYKTDVEPGKKSHEASFGLVLTKEAIPEIDMIIDEYVSSLGGVSIISKINLDILYKQFTYIYISLFGKDTFVYNIKGRRNLNVLEDEPLALEIQPPGLAVQAFDTVMRFNTCIKEYRGETKSNAIFTDITDLFYSKDDKDKLVISIDNATKFINLDYTTTNKVKTKIPLQFGKDIIPRNNLKKLEKLEPKITLMTYELTDTCIEYFIIIETIANGDLSIWCNVFSNKIYLKK